MRSTGIRELGLVNTSLVRKEGEVTTAPNLRDEPDAL